jgi:hypothetical protein
LEQLAGDVVRRPAAGRCHVDLARIALGVGDELWEGPGRDRWINHHDEGERGESADRRDVADEIEIQSVIKRRVDGVRRIEQFDGEVSLALFPFEFDRVSR